MVEMVEMIDWTLRRFVAELSSKEPVPGGGGASALVGAVGAALCSMVAELTTGKKKYEEYQADIEGLIMRVSVSVQKLLCLVEEDARVFAPLAAAYGLSKDDPQREPTLEGALALACSVPMEILKETAQLAEIAEELAQKGSRLAVSDVGVAASACRAAAEGAAMNVYINTRLMKNREEAERLNREAKSVLYGCAARCERVYMQIAAELGGT